MATTETARLSGSTSRPTNNNHLTQMRDSRGRFIPKPPPKSYLNIADPATPPSLQRGDRELDQAARNLFYRGQYELKLAEVAALKEEIRTISAEGIEAKRQTLVAQTRLDTLQQRQTDYEQGYKLRGERITELEGELFRAKQDANLLSYDLHRQIRALKDQLRDSEAKVGDLTAQLEKIDQNRLITAENISDLLDFFGISLESVVEWRNSHGSGV